MFLLSYNKVIHPSPISCHWPFSIPPENMFSGGIERDSGMKWVNTVKFQTIMLRKGKSVNYRFILIIGSVNYRFSATKL